MLSLIAGKNKWAASEALTMMLLWCFMNLLLLNHFSHKKGKNRFPGHT